MAIGEKKQLLRGMYAGPAVEGTEPAEAAPVEGTETGAVKRGRRMEAWLDWGMGVVAHLGLYFLFLVGAGHLVWTVSRHYQAGVELSSPDRTEAYVRDFFRMGGLSLLLGLLGGALFVLARELLPKRWKWLALGLLLVLLPLSVVTAFVLPTAFQRGRMEAFRRWDLEQMQKDAVEICEMFPQETNTPQHITPADAEYSALPAYTRDVVKPAIVDVHPRGVGLRLNARGLWDFDETIVVPSRSLSRSEEDAVAAEAGHSRVKEGEAVFRVVGASQFEEVEDPRLPASTEPAIGM